MPLSVKRRFVGAVRARERAAAGDRGALLGCCCMYDRNGRGTRAAAYQQQGLCLNWRGDLKSCCMSPAEYVGHMLAKVVWSPHGRGMTNYRDVEALYSGAAVLLDNKAGLEGHPGSADPAAFFYLSRTVPAIWLQGHAARRRGAWLDDTNVTEEWLARQYAGGRARRGRDLLALLALPHLQAHGGAGVKAQTNPTSSLFLLPSRPPQRPPVVVLLERPQAPSEDGLQEPMKENDDLEIDKQTWDAHFTECYAAVGLPRTR